MRHSNFDCLPEGNGFQIRGTGPVPIKIVDVLVKQIILELFLAGKFQQNNRPTVCGPSLEVAGGAVRVWRAVMSSVHMCHAHQSLGGPGPRVLGLPF